MKNTITSPYEFCEGGRLTKTDHLPLAGRLPMYWFSLSKAFYNLATHSPSLHSNILAIARDNEVVNSFDVELALNRCGSHIGVTLVVLEGSSRFLGPYRDCVLHGDNDEEGENWDVECDTCPPWSETPVDGMDSYLSVDWVLLHCRRQLSSLTLSTSCFPACLRNAKSDEFPMLKGLNLCKPTSTSSVTPDAIVESGLWRVPTLRQVHFEGIRAPGAPGIASAVKSWENITSLHLSESLEFTVDSTPDSTLPSSVHLILKRATNLQDLYVRLWDADYQVVEDVGRGMSVGPPLTHLRLERLCIEYTSDPRWPFEPTSSSFFDGLSAPNLREVEIHGNMTPPTPSAISFLQSHRHLGSLNIMGVAFTHSTLLDLLRGMDCLKRLAVGRSGWTDGAAGPLLKAGDHSCDGEHLCDVLLMRLTGSGWEKARAGVDRQLSGIGGRVLDTSLTFVEKMRGDTALQVDICPYLQELHIHGAKFTPVGLRTFIRSRSQRMQTVVIRLWDQIDCYDLWGLCEEMKQQYSVHLDATTVVRTEWRDFTSPITLKRKRIWNEIRHLSRRVKMKREDGWGKGHGQSDWDPLASVGDEDGWGTPVGSWETTSP